MKRQQQELEDLRKENEELRQVQGQVSEYETELERQLQERDAEAKQLKEELDRLRRLSQVGNQSCIFMQYKTNVRLCQILR